MIVFDTFFAIVIKTNVCQITYKCAILPSKYGE